MQRFTGAVQELSCIPVVSRPVVSLVRWLAAIPLTEWPQQRRDILMPAMVTDLAWHGFGEVAAPVVQQATPPGTSAYGLMLSAVMPGHCIEPHADEQAPYWLARVHVPLATNKKSQFFVDGKPHYMRAGAAYLVNILKRHSVTNDGSSPRIHLIFDIR